ncbi:hypothetical protein PINS_up010254 [Pythium insidiosum]|nr:hypothetical protein PINS_up010254 [Pythium insidiosum]
MMAFHHATFPPTHMERHHHHHHHHHPPHHAAAASPVASRGGGGVYRHEHQHQHHPFHHHPSSPSHPYSHHYYTPHQAEAQAQPTYSASEERAYYAATEDAVRHLPQTHALLTGALRRGKWTREEEEYAAATIQYFLAGVLPLSYGTTLRGYLAQQLHCDPMRVSKKLVPGTYFVGVRIDPKIGRRAYYPCSSDTPNLETEKHRAELHLRQLRGAFILSIEREELHERLARRQDSDDGSALADLATFASQSAGLPHVGAVAAATSTTSSPPPRQPPSFVELHQEQQQEPRGFASPSPAFVHHQRNASLPSLTELLRQQTQSLGTPTTSTRSPARPATASPTQRERAALPSHPLHGRRDVLWPQQDAVLPPFRLSRAATP